MLGINKLLAFLRRQVGLRTDAADASGSLHAKYKDMKDNLHMVLPAAKQGDTVRTESLAEVTTASTSYVRAKAFRVRCYGGIRVTFRGKRSAAPHTMTYEVRVNGQMVVTGTVTVDAYQTITANLDSITPGSKIEIYFKVGSGTGYLDQAQVKFDIMSSLAEVI